ncbi:MAG: DNA alkylation repair protein [Methanosarcinaceae archaeon]|nr:DNA alkylation repair protein [Methanosarcinaceae archaeon]
MNIINQIRNNLKENANPEAKKSSQRFFKEEIKVYGVKTPVAMRISKESFKEIKHLPKNEVFSLCDELLKSGYIEEAFVAYKWAEFLSRDYEKEDFQTFERWLNSYVSNWAECDTLCNHTIGSFIELFPDHIENLKEWTSSENRWVRRGAAVTLILPARKGLYLEDVFEIASRLLEDSDDLVRKGYGWLLKEASRKHQEQVFNFVMENKKRMPRTALRYAIEKMPAELRKEAMKK